MRISNKSGRPAGRQHRRVVLAALAATALSVGEVRTAAADATISIDARSTLAQGDGNSNVLPILKDIFQSGNAPDPSLQLIEDYTATAVNGELHLESSTAGSPAKPLGLGVTLCRITLN
ncbi:hypothetical protein JJB99_22300 [Bradyrhizobium diazoefficiens]|uniref:hypothetical protein n=1 Tax=Bradyrhizobium diazoefficiens TaxID=1355477 RepID=UPI00190A7654|nr:hypothetical protein [Bradyrhizobium diazoefficiens]QQO12215.1 hypothetical protein JJB99_22300 [Bradyrhizobium diazoefficiens]